MTRETRIQFAVLIPLLLLTAYGWLQTLSDPPVHRGLVYTGKQAGWQWVYYREEKSK